MLTEHPPGKDLPGALNKRMWALPWRKLQFRKWDWHVNMKSVPRGAQQKDSQRQIARVTEEMFMRVMSS